MQESKPVSNRDRPLMKKYQVGSKLIRLTMMHPFQTQAGESQEEQAEEERSEFDIAE